MKKKKKHDHINLYTTVFNKIYKLTIIYIKDMDF